MNGNIYYSKNLYKTMIIIHLVFYSPFFFSFLSTATHASVLVIDRAHHRSLVGLFLCLTVDRQLIHRELDSIDSGASTEVVHAGLKTTLPAVESHGRELAIVDIGQMNVHRLRLINERTTICCQVNNDL